MERKTETQLRNLADSGEAGKRELQDLLERQTGDRTDRRMSAAKLVDAMLAAYAAEDERRRLDAEREAAAAKAKAEREARAEERKDFDAWSSMMRAARDADELSWRLSVTMRWAYNQTDSWQKRLAEFTEKLAQNPVYTLGWSGGFVEEAADYEVAAWCVSEFEAGVTQEEMAEYALRETLRGAKRATSRSTSVMSNLTDDAMNAAWAKTYEKLSGRSFF